jgi:hypothetical protein
MSWTGEWPGEAECREFGWYSRHGDASKGEPYWVPCGPDHPDAEPDMNRLARAAMGLRGDAYWDVTEGRVKRRPSTETKKGTE